MDGKPTVEVELTVTDMATGKPISLDDAERFTRQTGRRTLSAVCGESWAIVPDKLYAIVELLELRISGGRLTAEEIEARVGNRPGRPRAISGGVAVLPLIGVISQRMNMITESSGGTSTDLFGADFDRAMADDSIGAVVLDVDSPGGSVFGVAELSRKIFQARGTKPIVAIANSLAASGAYWIGSAADEFVVTPGGEVGSIGVVAAHTDISGAEANEGIKTTLVSAGKKKTLGNPHEPLDEDGLASVQARVDTYYGMFVADIARNRGVSVPAVRNGFAEGDVVGAVEAVELGMVDRIDTLEGVMGRLVKRQSSRNIAADCGRRMRLAQSGGAST